MVEFFHDQISSDPDNQNKRKIRIDLGIDKETGQRLYDLHVRRALRGSLRALFAIFRASQFCARLRARTRTKKRPNGCSGGWRQFLESKCACCQERKPSECDCQDCTYVIKNLQRWHQARQGWHQALLEQAGGKPCGCRLHNVTPQMQAHERARAALLSTREALSSEREAETAAWAAAADGCTEGNSALGAAAEAASARVGEAERAHADAVRADADADQALRAANERRFQYERMSRDLEALHQALLPCGQLTLPEYTVTGERPFKLYPKACVEDNCPNKIFRGKEACGWDRVFGADCPVETSEDSFWWWAWEMRPRGNKEDGQPSYSPEIVPKKGTRGEVLAEFRPFIRKWLPHFNRDKVAKQGLRVFEDRKSGWICSALL